MSARRELEFDYEITTVDGECGRRLAAEQAAAILEVLEWFQRRTQPPPQARLGDGDGSASPTNAHPPGIIKAQRRRPVI
jgi:hypothetical protein